MRVRKMLLEKIHCFFYVTSIKCFNMIKYLSISEIPCPLIQTLVKYKKCSNLQKIKTFDLKKGKIIFVIFIFIKHWKYLHICHNKTMHFYSIDYFKYIKLFKIHILLLIKRKKKWMINEKFFEVMYVVVFYFYDLQSIFLFWIIVLCEVQ